MGNMVLRNPQYKNQNYSHVFHPVYSQNVTIKTVINFNSHSMILY